MQNFDSAKIGLAATKVKDALAIAMERLEINDYGGEEAEHLEAIADGEAAFRNDIVPILTEAPAMLAALRQVVDLAELHIAERSSSPEEESEFLACAYLLNARAILARIDATPTAQPAGDDPAITAAANLSRAGLVEAAGEALALQTPISEAGDRCASCGAEEGESHGAQCEARGFAMGADARRLDTGALRSVTGDDADWLEATASRDGGEC